MSDIKLYNGDCLELMKSIPDKSVDLILTDPPYGIDLTPQRARGRFKNTKVINDNTLDWLDSFVDESYRIAKNATCVFLWMAKHR